jgi:hypothetical protein
MTEIQFANDPLDGLRGIVLSNFTPDTLRSDDTKVIFVEAHPDQ